MKRDSLLRATSDERDHDVNLGWQTAVALNGVVALCYVAIATLVLRGLCKTRQLRSNQLALATAAIFVSCALHHAEHGLHIWFGGHHPGVQHDLREVFGSPHAVAVDLLGAVVAVWYLASRRQYATLLNTPAMFDDAVRSALEAQLRAVAYVDQLTGVANRAAFHEHAREVADSADEACVHYIDLVGFKAINDRLGHDAGDRVLAQVAQQVASSLGPEQKLFRLGGDEFTVVTRVDPAWQASERSVEVLAQLRHATSLPVMLREGLQPVGASIGGAAGPLGELESLLRQADVAMYADKARQHAVMAVPRARSESRPPVGA